MRRELLVGVVAAASLAATAAPAGASGGGAGKVPTTKEQCMGGGFESFSFNNQGECVRFVVRTRENPPAGPA